MLDKKQTLRMIFAFAACFALILVPVLARAQGGIVKGAEQGVKKGAEEVQKGVETGAEKTKEGAEATKNAITGQENQPSENRMKPGETPSSSETQSQQKSTGTQRGETQRGETGQKEQKEQKEMPKTAGELPLLALAGCLALAGAGTLKLVRQRS